MRLGSRILALAAISLAAACGGGGGDTTSPTPPNNNNPGTPTPPVQTGPVSTNSVSVSDDQFSPANIQVSPGTTVTWTWASGSTTHNVTFSDGTPGSGDKPAGSTFSRTFSTAGTFNYSCTIHPGMSGSVLVK